MPLYPYPELLVTSQVDGATLTAAARATCIPAAALYTVPPNFFDVIGKQIRIVATGRISSVVTTPGVARFDVNFLDSAAANAIVFDGLGVLLDSVATRNTQGWWLELLLTCRAIGTTGNLMGQGRWSCEDILGVAATAPKGGLTAMLPWNTAPAVGANFNTTLAQTIDLRFTQTAATGSMTVHQYSVERLN